MSTKKRKETFQMARNFQTEAERLEGDLRDPKIFGVKCWYSDVDLIEGGAARVLLGINPAGGEESQTLEREVGSLEWPYDRPGFNSWLDEIWPGKGANHQDAVQKVFRAAYGADWETKLRQTACFNVVPFRTRSASDLSRQSWDFGKRWSTEVLEHVRPRLLICNGNGRTNSPWAVVNSGFGLLEVNEEPIGARGSTASLKTGLINSGKLEGARVIGLPFLNRFAWPELFRRIGQMEPWV